MSAGQRSGRKESDMPDEHDNENHRGLFSGVDNGPKIGLKEINWRRLFSSLAPYKGRMAVAIISLLVSAAMGLSFPLVIVRLLDSVTSSHDMGTLNILAIALVGIFLVQAAFNFLQSYMLSYTGERIVYDLRTSLYGHLQKLSLDFYSSRRVGDLVSRLSSDVTQMRNMLTTNLTMILSQVMTLIGSIAILFTMNARFTLFILALVPVIVIVAFVFGSRIRKTSTRSQDQLADATVVAEEGLQGIRVVKSFGRQEHETGRYKTAMDKTFRVSLRMAVLNSLFGAIMMFLGFGSIAAIMWYGGQEVIAGRLTLAMITGFLMYGVSIAASLGGLGGLYGQLNAAVGGVKRVFDIMDTPPSIVDLPGALALPDVKGKIEFDDVRFGYRKNLPVVKDVSLSIDAGEIVALIGPSGAGKSTLFNLIPRFYDPESGSIRIDGYDIRTITQASLHSAIAIVPQETILFGGTVRENILYSKLDANESEMIEAAISANAHDFITELPNGYDTLVGERGTNLSGGQRQRISIARAILKNPRILLLDEATSSLDNESEGLVQEAFMRLMKNRTTLIIAHRLSTIRIAQRIAVMSRGRIIESGTHETLMALDGMYAKLYSMQFRESDELFMLANEDGDNPDAVVAS
jgi:ATP-binding cassette, subfamily B, bacterial MsbA